MPEIEIIINFFWVYFISDDRNDIKETFNTKLSKLSLDFSFIKVVCLYMAG